jgi:hypothetical protein
MIAAAQKTHGAQHSAAKSRLPGPLPFNRVQGIDPARLPVNGSLLDTLDTMALCKPLKLRVSHPEGVNPE